MPSFVRRSRYGPPSSPIVAMMTGLPPRPCRLYAMLPEHPPNSRRMSPIWNDTDSTCTWSGRMCRANRSGNSMMVSNAIEPHTRMRLEDMGLRQVIDDDRARRAYTRFRAGESIRGVGLQRGLATDLAHDGLLSPRHRQRVVDAFE